MKPLIKIGNAQAFWGDSPGAPIKLVTQQPDLDFLTMDYLAEVSMSILALQKDKQPSMGYAADFLDVLRALAPVWKKGSAVKIVTNAGGLNPQGCAQAAAEILKENELLQMKIGVVLGDDVSTLLLEGGDYSNLDTGQPFESIRGSLVSANAYLGGRSIAEALDRGADIVITGRVADPSLVVGCCAHSFGWGWNDYDKLAGATVAGHLIECGTQVTGGISTNWLEIPNPPLIGYPVIEMREDASFVVTKPERTGGVVNEQTVKEQLLYEIGDPGNYLSPDAAVSFLNLQLTQEGLDRISLSGAKGKPPPSSLKVSATFRHGYMAEGMLTLFGRHLRKKARLCSEVILQRVKDAGFTLEKTHFECIGAGDVVPGVIPPTPEWDLKECVFRMCARDPEKTAVECFAKEIASLVTSGAQGTTGYFGGRPKVRPVFGFWPCLIDSKRVIPKVEIVEAAGK